MVEQYLVQSDDLRFSRRFNTQPVRKNISVSFLEPCQSDVIGLVNWETSDFASPEDNNIVKWSDGCFQFPDDKEKMLFVCNDAVSMQIYTSSYCSFYQKGTSSEKKVNTPPPMSFLSKSARDLWPDIPRANRVVDIALGAVLFFCLMSTIDFNECELYLFVGFNDVVFQNCILHIFTRRISAR